MYKKEDQLSLNSLLDSHLYTGLSGMLFNYCHRNLEKCCTDALYSKILEIGPGTAPHITYIKHQFDEYYIAEISDYALGCLSENNVDNLVKFDGQQLPFRDNYFDRIVISHVLEHVNNPESFIEEMMRTLKKSGLLSISLPTDPGLLWRFARFIKKLGNLTKTLNISAKEYDYINAIEHVNSIFSLRSILHYHFRSNIDETFLPFRIKSVDINLFCNIHITKH